MTIYRSARDFALQIHRQKDNRLDEIAVNGAQQAYKLGPCTNIERRFNGRLDVVPKLNLEDYEFGGVIDYLRIELTSTKPMSPINVFKKLRAAAIKPGWIKALPLPDETKRLATRFTMRIDDPTPASLHGRINAIKRMGDFDCDGRLALLEISIDIYPKARGDEVARITMTDHLRRHILPNPAIWRDVTTGDTWPRWVGNPDPKKAKPDGTPASAKPHYLVGKGETELCNHLARGRFSNRKPAPSNATTYFGCSESGRGMIRIMDKVIDKQSRGKGAYVALKPAERRTRIEVELSGPALKAFLGDLHVDRLHEVDFRKLRRRFFQFVKLTVPGPLPAAPGAPAPSLGTVIVDFERQKEISTFHVAGAVGLHLLQQHRAKNMRGRRRAALRHRGIALDRERQGLGNSGFLLSYAKLNAKCEDALRKINRAWNGGA